MTKRMNLKFVIVVSLNSNDLDVLGICLFNFVLYGTKENRLDIWIRVVNSVYIDWVKNKDFYISYI